MIILIDFEHIMVKNGKEHTISPNQPPLGESLLVLL